MKNKKDLFDPFGDVASSILLIMLTLGLAVCGVATTKFVYEGGGIWPAIGWVAGWIACFVLSQWAAKNL